MLQDTASTISVIPHLPAGTTANNNADGVHQINLATGEQIGMSGAEVLVLPFFIFMQAYNTSPQEVLTFLIDRK